MVALVHLFGSRVEDYELGRPSWPATLIEGLPHGITLELGAGTGKLTRTLIDRHRVVVAAEPDPAMRSVLAREIPGVVRLTCTAEQIPLDDASVDLVIGANTFHFFSAAAFGEIARVLRGGGVCAVVHYQPAAEPDPPRSAAAIEVLQGRVGQGWARERIRRRCWRGELHAASFRQTGEVRLPHVEPYTAERLVAYYASRSEMAELTAEQLEDLKFDLAPLLGSDEYLLRFEMTTEIWTRIGER